ncbi:MAG: hypothetical protein LBR66_01995 [Candidatus Symbiothrix sp.]|jgi:tRNA A37 threonylcarbamoyladenosine biosynthesis protein TsaE|nr:hypothetical protein [Candidatus Symbiothrix sp.]
MLDFYRNRLLLVLTQNNTLKRSGIVLAIFRFVGFLATVVYIYLALSSGDRTNWIFAALFFAGFIQLILYSDKIAKEHAFVKATIKICEQEVHAILLRKYPQKDGAEEIDPTHPFTYDLDVFGKKSLFHLLNRTYTRTGYDALCDQLDNPLQDAEKIKARQAAVKELARQNPGFLIEFRAALESRLPADVGEHSILLWLANNETLPMSNRTKILIRVVPWCNISLLCACFAMPSLIAILVAFVGLQILLTARFKKDVQGIKFNLNKIFREVMAFDVIAKNIASPSFQAASLQQIQQTTALYHRRIHKLAAYLDSFDRGDSFVGAIGNILFLNHITTAWKVLEWKNRNKECLQQTYQQIGELETIISLAVFKMNHPSYVFPDILPDDSDNLLVADQITHPLLSQEKRVGNNIRITKNNLLIITGANMAGKSTFLRTVGVNLLLAHIGAPVCALRFRHRIMSLFSSMRTTDDIQGVSYFYAEALRIEQLFDTLKENKTTLLLLDELFRGTNSDDRMKASNLFLQRLTKMPEVSALIATHDLSITALEKQYPNIIHNYCFECTIKNELLHFDYQLRRGITQSNNACWILKKMGILSE